MIMTDKEKMDYEFKLKQKEIKLEDERQGNYQDRMVVAGLFGAMCGIPLGLLFGLLSCL